MKIIYEGASAEITIKKSRFIATVASVRSEEEASLFIAEMKKKYWDCRHNCSAFVIGSETKLTRSSDDGEPAGTAGRPILDAILGSGITDVCVVVSRYFGGTLLGTGGLVRAYTDATVAGLAASKVADKEEGNTLSMSIGYDLLGKVKYAAESLGLHQLEEEYTEGVKVSYICPKDEVSRAMARLTDVTSGRVSIEISDPLTYIKNGQEISIL